MVVLEFSQSGDIKRSEQPTIGNKK
jgi:hypothetical protein